MSRTHALEQVMNLDPGRARPGPDKPLEVPERHPNYFPRDRQPYRLRMETLYLKGEQWAVLMDTAKFRVCEAKDLAKVNYLKHWTQYRGENQPDRQKDWSRFWNDVRTLQRHKLIRIQKIPRAKEHFWKAQPRPDHAVTLTKKGLDLIQHQFKIKDRPLLIHTPGRKEARPPLVNQKLYGGEKLTAFVRHDSALYRCYREEVERQREKHPRADLQVIKVTLGREIKRESKAIQRQIDRETGSSGNVPIQTADLRIEMQDKEGNKVTTDLEYISERYSQARIESKAKAGFTLYTSSGNYDKVCRVIDRKSPLTEVFAV